MAQMSDFEKAVKIRLIEMDKNQVWLIEQIKERSGDYFDQSYLNKLLRGKLKGKSRSGKPSKIEEICDILGLEVH